jgi:hypothetical protein
MHRRQEFTKSSATPDSVWACAPKPWQAFERATVVDAKADVVDTKADVVDAKVNVVDARADVVIARADVVIAKADVVIARADVVDAKADAVIARADVVIARADAVITRADLRVSPETWTAAACCRFLPRSLLRGAPGWQMLSPPGFFFGSTLASGPAGWLRESCSRLHAVQVNPLPILMFSPSWSRNRKRPITPKLPR